MTLIEIIEDHDTPGSRQLLAIIKPATSREEAIAVLVWRFLGEGGDLFDRLQKHKATRNRVLAERLRQYAGGAVPGSIVEAPVAELAPLSITRSRSLRRVGQNIGEASDLLPRLGEALIDLMVAKATELKERRK